MKKMALNLLILISILFSCNKQVVNLNKNNLKYSIIKIFPSKENIQPIEIIINFKEFEILIFNNKFDITKYTPTPPKKHKIDISVDDKNIFIKPKIIKLRKEDFQILVKILDRFTENEFKSRFGELKGGLALSMKIIFEDNKIVDFQLINDFSNKDISFLKELFFIINKKSSINLEKILY